MIHPRLSISALCSLRWSFEEDLALWRELGVGWGGLMASKLHDVEQGFAQLDAAGIRIATAIGNGFDLRRPDTWEASRATLHALIDSVAAHGGWSVYTTPGRTTGAAWRDVADVFAEAFAPTIAYARGKGVRFAIEPSLRTDVSFVNTLRDAVHLAELTGIGVVVDFGNCWMERDLRETMRRAAPYTALVQIGDVAIGSPMPSAGAISGRVPFGEGDLAIERLMSDVLDTGYDGPLDLEIPGMLGETEGYAPVTRRAVVAASALMERMGF